MRYIVGDIHGCLTELKTLLSNIDFNPAHDELWSLGDLVNRGPDSLGVLRFFYELGDAGHVILGNHDLYLLGTFYANKPLHRHTCLQTILNAPDCDVILAWLRKQPLLHRFDTENTLLVHAGISPFWTENQAIALAEEARNVLQSEMIIPLLHDALGSQPRAWDDTLTGLDRYRYILNALTRMRYVSDNHHFNFSQIGPIGSQPAYLSPWFKQSSQLPADTTVIFGHWAALMGETHEDKRLCLDTGCVYGGKLTAYCLETQKYYQTDGVYA